MEKEGKTMIKVYQIKDQKAIFPHCSFTYGMGIGEGFDPVKNKDLYVHVADIAGDDFNEAFQYGNIGPESFIKRHDSMHSISIGDIMIDDKGNQVIVASAGFDKVEVI
tara:strand:+ start:561 stop:884 length:324 start_codon:yes stop_codon:yes gene_type:complete